MSCTKWESTHGVQQTHPLRRVVVRQDDVDAGWRTDDRIDRRVVHLPDVVGEGSGGVDDALGFRPPAFTWSRVKLRHQWFRHYGNDCDPICSQSTWRKEMTFLTLFCYWSSCLIVLRLWQALYKMCLLGLSLHSSSLSSFLLIDFHNHHFWTYDWFSIEARTTSVACLKCNS